MHGQRFLSSLVVTAALLAPGMGQAVAAAQTRAEIQAGPVTLRVYDKVHKDYHVWDDQEDRTYREYLSHNHQPYRPIAKISQKRQTAYWNTRHTDDKK